MAKEVAKKSVSKPLTLLISCANSKRPSKSIRSRALKEKEKEKCMGRCAAGAWSVGWSAWLEWVGRPQHVLPVKM